MKKKGGRLFFVIGLLLTLNFISASFEIGDVSYSIETIYGPKNNIKGWINISLNKETSDSVFRDSFENSISLIDLINKNTGFECSCSTMGCISDYSISNEEETKTFDLNAKKSRLIGFKFNGEITAINSIDFVIESDAGISCNNQIELDFLNDGTIDFGNNKMFEVDCSFLRNYGCFNDSEDIEEIIIGSTPYCQRVTLSESPGFRLGAWVKEEIAGNKKLIMNLYSIEGYFKKSCKLTKEGVSIGKEILCDINYLVTKSKDYYVCIRSDEGTGTYKTKGYSSETLNCGFYGLPTKTESNAYKIFAEGRGFDKVGTLNISNSLPEGNTLNEMVSSYISETYGSLDCSNDCVVPIRIDSGENQQITIKNLKAIYNKPGLSGITNNKFYDLTEIPARISSEFQKLYLDEGGFSLPSDYGNVSFELKFNDEEIFSGMVFIEKVPIIKSLTPTTTASAFPTLFSVSVESVMNITKYEWDFGDGNNKTTTTNKVVHTYNSTGKYGLTISVTDSGQRSSYKKFDISVGSPEEIINTTIKKKSEDLNNIKTQIEEFNYFYQDSLNSVLDIESLDDALKKIEKDYENAFFEEDYNKIMTDLLNLEIPESISVTKRGDSMSFYPKRDNIDLYILSEIGGGDYNIDEENKYIDAIFAWNQENMETKITFDEISFKYEYSEEPILNIFELEIAEKKSLSREPYLILSGLDNLEFKENYLEEEKFGYIYITLKKDQKISFSTTEDIDFTDLPLFISPEITELSITREGPSNGGGKLLKWSLLIPILLFLVLIGFFIYMVLQTWYKNKYEDFLFKNRNDLYNLITYIENARKKGAEDKEISSKLKKSGWKSEQVSYALKKHVGKRTGMFEIPIGKILDKLKKKKTQNIPQEKRFSIR